MNIFDNKPPVDLVWTLGFTVETGYYRDKQWQPGSVPGADSWMFSVMYDRNILMNCVGVKETQTVQCSLADTKEYQEHELIIVFRGNRPDQFESVKLTMTVEGVDVGNWIQRCECYKFDQDSSSTRYPGQTHMIFPGDQRLTISTPIYRWLYDQRDIVLGRYWNMVKLVNDH